MERRQVAAGRSGGAAGQAALWFLLIVVLALAIRLVYLAQIRDNPLFEHPILDAQVHHEWAGHFTAGEAWSVDRDTQQPIPYFRAPLYVWFLGTLYRLFGADPGLPPRVIQSLLGALGCGLVFLLGRRLFGPLTGIIAGVAAAGTWTLVYFDNELLIVPLIVVLDLACLLLLVLAHDHDRWHLWSAAGLVLGLSAIARPNILLFAPLVCLWILLLQRRTGMMWRRGILRCLAFGIALLLPILPITLRNLTVGGDTVLISSQGGVNFYIGNNPKTDGITARVPGTPVDFWGSYDATRRMARRALGHEPKPSEVSRYFLGEGLRFWRESPGKALRTTAAKARLFLSRQEYANNKCIYTFVDEFAPFLSRVGIGFGIVAPLGLLGLAISLRRGAHLFPLWGFLATYSLSVIIFFVTARFRMPVVPVLIIYAAFATVWLGEMARARDFRRLLPAVAALALLVPFVLYVPGPDTFRVYRGSEELFCALGNSLALEGDAPAALGYLDRAAEGSRHLLANPEIERRQREIGRNVLRRALVIKGHLLARQQQFPEALAAFREALPLVPAAHPTRAELDWKIAVILDALGNHEEAEQHRQEARRAAGVSKTTAQGGH